MLLILLLLIGASQKVYLKRQKVVKIKTVRRNNNTGLFSNALFELVSAAGGVYISVIMLITFLEIQIPEKWPVLAVSLDPIALVSLILAAIQPIIVRISQAIKGLKKEERENETE